MNRRMLTKEDEKEAGDEIEVRREDQNKINSFSRLHQRELVVEDELKALAKEREELDDITTELELADEDELVRYKVGDAFFHVSLPVAQEMLGLSASRVERELRVKEEKLEDIRAEMTELKVELYARFGKTINLEA